MSSGSMTPTAGGTAGPSTKGLAPSLSAPVMRSGDIVLLQIDPGVFRPLIVVTAADGLISGTICCDPSDHAAGAFRKQYERHDSPTVFSGRPDRLLPLGFVECASYGPHPGQWRLK